MDRKPICTLSLDLDNQWSYMKTHGDSGWEAYPSYFDIVVPRVLRILDELQWKITWFIVGLDATRPENQSALQQITASGHEVGNHSFHHEPWLHLYPRDQIRDELERTEQAI
ncbi:MAG: polysaccharide deacetylase family protein, partial [Gemmataceae bacterium]